jgi:hypothetical protein
MGGLTHVMTSDFKVEAEGATAALTLCTMAVALGLAELDRFAETVRTLRVKQSLLYRTHQ